MASTLPFVSRLFRPFTTSSRLSLNPESSPSQSSATSTEDTENMESTEKCTLAAGCFWGVEHMFRKHFEGKGLLDARVGYIGGDLKHPGYRAVCSGRTGHAESVEIIFDPEIVQYTTLIKFFYRMHDTTTKNQQGMDQGTQYRSAIFYHTPEQKLMAEEITRKVNAQWWKGMVTTEVVEAGEFFDAETYHQRYLEMNMGGYDCPNHYVRPFPELK